MSRNVVLITVDSLRADHCGFLGAERELTPTLDSLAEESLVFERAFAPGPRTPSSIPMIFTGEFYRLADLGVYDSWEEKAQGWQARRRRIRNHMQRFRTLAERMHDQGYATAGVTANPWTTPDTGFDAGFDEFHAIKGPDTSRAPWYSKVTRRLGESVGIDWGDVLLTWTDFYDTIRTARESLSEPYFLWVFLMDPHQPYITPRHYREENTGIEMLYANARYNYAHGYTEDLPLHLDRRLERAYRDTVRSVDEFVKRYRDDFAEDDPVTVFHADHGEAFQEHGTLGHRPQLYRENVHVPLFVHGIKSRERVEAPVSLRDIPDIITGAVKEGCFNPGTFERELVLSKTEEGERVGVRGREWSYQTSAECWEYVYEGGQEELYQVFTDPDERANLANEYPEIAAAIRTLVWHHELDQNERESITDALAGVSATFYMNL